MPLVSVVIATYNQDRFIATAVECALAQTLHDVEIIVVDDGSHDDTRVVLARYGTAIRTIFQANAGQAVARNRGVAESRGEFIAFLDGDDVWLPEKLEQQIDALRHSPGASFCACGFYVVDEALRPLRLHEPASPDRLLDDLLLKGNRVGPPTTVMIRRELFERLGGFDPVLSYCCDWDLWVRLARVAPFCAVKEPLAGWRVHGSNLTRHIPALERDSNQLLEKALADPGTPAGVRARSGQVRGHNWIVLAGSYLQAHHYPDGLRCLGNALRAAPLRTVWTLADPLRRLRRIFGGRLEGFPHLAWPGNQPSLAGRATEKVDAQP